MTTNKIAFQGEFGANSDIACRNVFPTLVPLPCATFEDTLNAVVRGKADFGMIPIENTLAGRVADIHHLLPRFQLHIVDEYFLPIHFQLMILPDATIADIKTVHSHVHALGQCRKLVRDNHWRAVVASDTAGAAKLIKEQGNKSQAALAPALAADLYGLKIVMQNVEDDTNNVTRFVVLSPTPENPVRQHRDDKIITTFLFRVRNVPAALYKVLGGFATNGVNMTKLESYQISGSFNAAQFLADIEGHPEDPMVKLAFDELSFFSDELRILGVYKASSYRQKLYRPTGC